MSATRRALGDEIEPLKGRRAYLILRDRIMSGELAPGTRLPGEPSLAAEHGVARVTIRRALGRLTQDGLVRRRPGSGTFVREAAMTKPVVADFANLFQHHVEMGTRTGVRLLSFAYGVPPAGVAEAMGLAPGERTQRSVRVRLIDEEPFSYLTTHVPERVGLTYSEADLAHMALLGLLERSGVAIERASQSITAALAGPDVADALGVEIGTPLLSLTRAVFDAQDSCVEHLHALYRPDRYVFNSELVRTGSVGERHWTSAVPKAANSDSAEAGDVHRTRRINEGRPKR